MWQEHFKKLYNSCSNTTHRNKLYSEEHMNNVVNLHTVSVYDILAAMHELKTNNFGKTVVFQLRHL